MVKTPTKPRVHRRGGNGIAKSFNSLFAYVNERITAMNQSKLFAGLIILTLNISSKFVSIKLSKSMESYLKYTFSRDILIFAMAWMGTRDIYVALFVSFVFSMCMNYFFNEESAFCCLPKSFTEHYSNLSDNSPTPITPEEVAKAKETLAKYDAQQNPQDNNSGGTDTSKQGTSGTPGTPITANT